MRTKVTVWSASVAGQGGTHAHHHHHEHGAGVRASGGDVTPDQAFIERMVPHHLGAELMIRPLLRRGRHPELKALARRMAAEQARELRLMQRWSTEWFGTRAGSAPAPSWMPGTHGPSLATAKDVDEAFLFRMVVHHQSAVRMALEIRNTGQHPELRALAASIVRTQRAQIAQMQAWRRAWYPG
jgi:uncharacterized protein (DUF305 family)